MNENELIFCQKDDNIYSCGYSIKSLFLLNNIKANETFIDDELNSYTIPAGLTYFLPQQKQCKKSDYSSYSNVHSSLLDKLLDLVDTEDKIKYRNNKTLKKKLKCLRKSCKNNKK